MDNTLDLQDSQCSQLNDQQVLLTRKSYLKGHSLVVIFAPSRSGSGDNWSSRLGGGVGHRVGQRWWLSVKKDEWSSRTIYLIKGA